MVVKLTSNTSGKYLSELFSSLQVRDLLECIGKEKSVFAVVDDGAYKASAPLRNLVEILDRNTVQIKRVKTSERLKSPETVLSICEWLLKKKADRSSLLLGIGGGVLTDMAGFAASIYMRGIRFALVPTTLLAQVDAGAGGKTGVNFCGYKNMLGVIRQPEFTYLCPAFLASLPQRDFFSGAAELLKTFMIDNRDGAYGRAVLVLSCIAKAEESTFPETVASYEQELFRLVSEALRIKMAIVSADPFEHGERRKLNLGHTFAHAIEHCAAEQERDITHGEAVAMGLVLAAGMSEKQGLAREGFRDRIAEDLETCGLGTECPFEKVELMGAMQHDKKNVGESLYFVLMREVGDVVVAPVRLPGKQKR